MNHRSAGRSGSVRVRDRLSYANVMATLGVFIALGGSAWAVAIGRNDVGAREIAKNAVGTAELKNDKTKGKDVDESSLGEVPSAGTAAVATTAGSATTAAQLDGLAPASINAAGLAFGDDNCDVGAVTQVCASTQIDQPRTSDVLVLATASFFSTDADASGSCDVNGPGNQEFAGFAEMGQALAVHPNVDHGGHFVVPGLFQDVPAGPSTFSLICSEDTGNLLIGNQHIVAVRLSG